MNNPLIETVYRLRIQFELPDPDTRWEKATKILDWALDNSQHLDDCVTDSGGSACDSGVTAEHSDLAVLEKFAKQLKSRIVRQKGKISV